MAEPCPATFINLDLEIDANFDLTPLADFFGKQVFVLYNGATETGFRLAVEPVIGGVLSSDPLACTNHFLALLTGLPAELKAFWEACSSRLFDYGFDGGLECPPLRATLPADMLLKIATLGACVEITVYPYRESPTDEE